MAGNPEPGDKVEIKLAKEKIEGRLLESHQSGIFLIKLKTGYNIGLTREEILGIRVIEKRKKLEPEEAQISRDKEKKNVALIIIGGTISSKLDSQTGGVSWLTNPSELLKFYPELQEVVNVVKVEIPFMIASESMNSKHWKKIAKVAQSLLNKEDIDGIIITHGTDFLHYTSAALSFMLRNLNKPVVLTYSQRSSDRASSDARLNLICAARVASSDIAEVVLVGHANINDNFCYAMRGTKVRKLHSSRRDAFKSVNEKPLAKIWKDKIEILGQHRKRKGRKVELDDSFSDKVALVKFYPGQNPDILDFYKNKGYKGIVLEMGGLGHVTTEGNLSWIPKLKKLIKSGFIVCAAAQTIFGRLNPKVYSPGRELEKAGVIYLEDMLAETALVKLGFILGHKTMKSKEKIKEMMLTNFSGEINKRLEEEFL